MGRWSIAGTVALLLAGGLGDAVAREPCPNKMTELRPRVMFASLLERPAVRLTFVGHATFVIESPGGVRIATDYNDFVRPVVPPHVATMNRAHRNHYTDNPDPAIEHVLRGWATDGSAPHYDVTFRDVRVTNVVTNIRDMVGGTRFNGNSIFVFEAAGLCIAHLGHLHHTLTPEHLADLGRIDVVLAPVDGGWTIDQGGMVEVLRSIGARLVIPMHWFTPTTLERFLSRVRETHAIELAQEPTIVLTRADLPASPTVLVLPGR